MGMISIRWDRILIIQAILLGLIGVGIVILATADEPWTISHYGKKQFVYWLIGIAVILGVSQLDYRKITRAAWPIYIGIIISLIAVLIIGKIVGGSQRWIPIGPIRFQPSEFAKIGLVFTCALVIVKSRDIGWLVASIFSLIVTLPIFVLVYLEPDLGTSIVFLVIWFGTLVIGGMDFWIILSYMILSLLTGVIGIKFFLKDYQLERLKDYLDPEASPLDGGYQLIQSKTAIGHAGLFGQGLFKGSQNMGGFLPGEHTDFIFSIAFEELGFVGAGLILIGLFSLLLTILAISLVTDDMLGKLVAGGIFGWLGFQIILNVGITLGLFPVTGIPLPFISYGGSAFLANSIAIGILVSVYKHAAVKSHMLHIRGV